jgi:hypothetical protein
LALGKPSAIGANWVENKQTFVARAPRGRFGRWVKAGFWAFQVVMLLLMLGQCTLVLPYLRSEDPEVAMGAVMFGTWLGLGLLTVWPLGTLLLGLLTLFTRGKRVVVELPG